MNEKLKFSFGAENNLSDIKQLLAASDLLFEDISTAHLKHFLLGWEGSRMVAVVGIEIKDHCALLRSLAVDAEFRNQRIATTLVAEIESHARSLNIEALYLLTMTAELFFEKCGYKKTARDSAPTGIQGTAEFQSLCPASAVCMVKHLED